jgi:uncharacterized protein HemX
VRIRAIAGLTVAVALGAGMAAPVRVFAQQMSVAEYQKKSAKDAAKQQNLMKKSAKQKEKAQKKLDKANKKQLEKARKSDAKATAALHH